MNSSQNGPGELLQNCPMDMVLNTKYEMFFYACKLLDVVPSNQAWPSMKVMWMLHKNKLLEKNCIVICVQQLSKKFWRSDTREDDIQFSQLCVTFKCLSFPAMRQTQNAQKCLALVVPDMLQSDAAKEVLRTRPTGASQRKSNFRSLREFGYIQ